MLSKKTWRCCHQQRWAKREYLNTVQPNVNFQLLKMIKQRDAWCPTCVWWVIIVETVNRKKFHILEWEIPLLQRLMTALLFRHFPLSIGLNKPHQGKMYMSVFPKWSHALSSYVTTVIIGAVPFFGICHKNIEPTWFNKWRRKHHSNRGLGRRPRKKLWWHLFLKKYLWKSRLCFHSNQLCWVHWALLKIKKTGRKKQSQGCLGMVC